MLSAWTHQRNLTYSSPAQMFGEQKEQAVTKAQEGFYTKMTKANKQQKKNFKTVKTIQPSTAKVQFSTLNYITLSSTWVPTEWKWGKSKQEGTGHPETGLESGWKRWLSENGKIKVHHREDETCEKPLSSEYTGNNRHEVK